MSALRNGQHANIMKVKGFARHRSAGRIIHYIPHFTATLSSIISFYICHRCF